MLTLCRWPRRKLLPRKPPPRRLQRRKLRSLLLLLLLPPPLVPPLPAPAGRESGRRLWSWGRRRVPSLRRRYGYVVFLGYLTFNSPLHLLFVCLSICLGAFRDQGSYICFKSRVSSTSMCLSSYFIHPLSRICPSSNFKHSPPFRVMLTEPLAEARSHQVFSQEEEDQDQDQGGE